MRGIRFPYASSRQTYWEMASRYGVLVAILLAVVVGSSILTPEVLQPSNLAGMSVFGVEVGLMAFGETLVILGGGGGIDLSVGAMYALSQTVLGAMFQAHYGVWTASVGALVMGSILGATNGFFICVLGIPAILVTLATLFAYDGLALVVANGVNISGFPPTFGVIGQSSIAGVPFQLLVIYIPVAVFLWYASTRAAYGYRLRLCGTNEVAARLAGINVRGVRFWAYVAAGLLSGVAGVIGTSRLLTARPDAGATANIEAITIAVLGGTAIFGGEGSISGTALATLVIALLGYSFGLANINSIIETGSVGGILIVAIWGQTALSSYSQRHRAGANALEASDRA